MSLNLKEFRFGDLYYEPSRNGIYKKKEFHGRGAKIVNMGELFGHEFVGGQVMKRVELNEKELQNFTLKEGDLIFGRRSLVESGAGKCSLVEGLTEPTTFESSIIRVRIDQSKVVPLFLFYYFKSYLGRAKILAIAGGTNVKGIRGSDLQNIVIELPNFKVQYQVALILKNHDILIENNNRRIAILEDMAQSLYREWFVHFRFPGHEDCQFVDSELGRIPEGWDTIALEDICERITDGAHKSPKSVEQGVPMASVKDMHDFGFNLATCRLIAEEDYLELKRQDSVVKANDILVAKDGSYLKHTFVVEKDLQVALLSSIAMIRPNKKVKPHWLAYCLRSQIVKDRMKQCVSGVAIPRIVLKDFRKFKIYLPVDDLMNEWNELVEPMVHECWNLISRNENLKKQRDMLLPKLISGKVEV